MEKYFFILKIYFNDKLNNKNHNNNNNYINNDDDYNLIELTTIKHENYIEFLKSISNKLNIDEKLISKITYNNIEIEKPIEIIDNMSIKNFYNHIKKNEITKIINVYLKKRINFNINENGVIIIENKNVENKNNEINNVKKEDFNKILNEFKDEIIEKYFPEFIEENENNYSGNICNQCKKIIFGYCFKCSECLNFFLCNKCFNYNQKNHKHQHKFYVN
jgi:hypothetical protein